MNGRNESQLPDDRLLDQLVDGELSETEYQAALGALESHPGGWRRCALAFLESQAWGREFRQLRTETPPIVAATNASRRGWSWLYAGAMAISCAASFLLAFGIANQLYSRSRSLVPDEGLATLTAPKTPGTESVVNRDGFDTGPEMSPLGRYRLVVNGASGSAQEVEMPVFAPDDPRADLLLDEYTSTPHEIIRELRNRGNDVQRRRYFLPMRGNTGAPLYVPVDELQVTPVSNRSFH